LTKKQLERWIAWGPYTTKITKGPECQRRADKWASPNGSGARDGSDPENTWTYEEAEEQTSWRGRINFLVEDIDKEEADIDQKTT